MPSLTITEALAEIKTISKRLEKKRAAFLPFLVRQDGIKDPLEKEGGSAQYIQQELQAIGDLEKRIVALRQGINRANDYETITIEGTSRSINEWLTWRREVAPGQKALLERIRSHIESHRAQARKSGVQVLSAGTEASNPADYVVNINEIELNKKIEELEEILGTLDGKLSLKNATALVSVV